MQNKYIWGGGAVFLVILILWFALAEKSEAPIVEEPSTGAVLEIETEEARTETVREFVVEGKNFSFLPNSITVKQGEKVRIIFQATEGFHDFVIDEYGVATKQLRAPDSEVLEFVAEQAGTFKYYCSVGTHREMGMIGTLVVEE